MKPKFLLFILFFLPFLSACNSTDDVGRIFTGKTWKLTGIWEEKKPEMVNLWSDEAQKRASLKLLEGSNNFFVTFDGAEDKNIIIGNFNGRGVVSSFEGKWKANGENNEFSTSNFKQTGGSESDILAKVFIEGLKPNPNNNNRDNRYYSGDENNLYIYFTYENKTIRLAFGKKN